MLHGRFTKPQIQPKLQKKHIYIYSYIYNIGIIFTESFGFFDCCIFRLSSKASLISPTSRYVWHVWRLFRRALLDPGWKDASQFLRFIHDQTKQTSKDFSTPFLASFLAKLQRQMKAGTKNFGG